MKRVIEDLGQMIATKEWNEKGWDLTDLLSRILQANGAPVFDIAVQVDDRNTSRYVLSVGLPRQSGVMPQFYSTLPKVLLFITYHAAI